VADCESSVDADDGDDDVEPCADVCLPAENVEPLPNGTWLSTAHIVRLLRHPHADKINRSIPKGHKANVFCIVDNSDNTARHGRGVRRAYDDDCGAWTGGGGRLNNFPYICGDEGALRRVFLSGGQYCDECKVEGRRVYVPIDPQPQIRFNCWGHTVMFQYL